MQDRCNVLGGRGERGLWRLLIWCRVRGRRRECLSGGSLPAESGYLHLYTVQILDGS